MDYGISRADMVPAIAIDFSPIPSTTNPLGAKGHRRQHADGDERNPRRACRAWRRRLPIPVASERIWRAIHSFHLMNSGL
jgi:hypothetical protein